MAGTWNVAGWQRASIPPRQAGSRRVLRENICKHHQRPSMACGTRTRWRDAGAVAGRGRGGRTRTSSVPTMDGGWVRGDMFRVKATGVLVDGGDMERGRVATRIHPTQAGRVTSCFTRKHMQTPPTPVHGMRDADTLAGRGRGGRTRARWQDADKHRPYYGRGLGAWGHVPRKSDGCPGRWR